MGKPSAKKDDHETIIGDFEGEGREIEEFGRHFRAAHKENDRKTCVTCPETKNHLSHIYRK